MYTTITGSVITVDAHTGAVVALEDTERGHDPAERYAYADGAGHVGVIASVTRPTWSR